MEKPKPDDSQVREYAAAHDMHFQWRTIPEHGCWKAQVTLGRYGTPGCTWVGRGETDQEALDEGMRYATSYYEETSNACKQIGNPPVGW
ncbi:hypothetical protein EDF56_101126 [Novosphingobium sp. PhB165]|uniref:hypothetical protein n=1 Tax=Novosphingobium sp. PhB165 TaxID=2485105 RepID=UPI0010E8AC29|nr:hypothetical protein [Novosphingobium sp. PhB165]TCM21462.1 hypothetical protein EDF56_101126 [Novosphingobium sp. PhB165]